MAPKATAPSRVMTGLPTQVTSPVDVGRLMRELEMIDNSLLQLGMRAGGEAISLPKISHLMEQTVELNKLNLLQEDDRQLLAQFLAAIKKESPIVHMSFSADPAPAFIEKLIVWLRTEIHPVILLTVGLQPTIGAGCILRTTNKYFDFSLRQDFQKKRKLLQESLIPPTPQVVPVPASAPAAVTATETAPAAEVVATSGVTA